MNNQKTKTEKSLETEFENYPVLIGNAFKSWKRLILFS